MLMVTEQCERCGLNYFSWPMAPEYRLSGYCSLGCKEREHCLAWWFRACGFKVPERRHHDSA